MRSVCFHQQFGHHPSIANNPDDRRHQLNMKNYFYCRQGELLINEHLGSRESVPKLCTWMNQNTSYVPARANDNGNLIDQWLQSVNSTITHTFFFFLYHL